SGRARYRAHGPPAPRQQRTRDVDREQARGDGALGRILTRGSGFRVPGSGFQVPGSVSGHRSCDIAIVGAGPAGTWAARALALRGARVVLIDGSHPREKPCGGGLTGRALEIVAPAASPESFGGVHITSASFEHRSRRAVVGLGTEGQALVVASRRAFDGALL